MNNIANDFTTLVNDGEHAISNKFAKLLTMSCMTKPFYLP